MQQVLQKAKSIKLLLLDVDGVLTDGKIYFTEEGIELKAFHTQDGIGIKTLQKSGIIIGVVTSRQSKIVDRRMAELGVTHVYQAQENKLDAYETIKTTLNLADTQIAMMGDDLPDLPLIQRAGLGITVANAVPLVKAYADFETSRIGGDGAVREACDIILQAQRY